MPAKDEDTMKKIWTELTRFAVEHKPWVKDFWDSADSIKSGFMDDDVWVSQTWDGPVLSLKKDSKPVAYIAPRKAPSPGSTAGACWRR